MYVKERYQYFLEKWQTKNRAQSVSVLPAAILRGNLPALNNVRISLRGAVAQQGTEPEKFNLPTVKYVLSLSESSNSIQNYFLEAVTLAKKGCLRSGIGQNTLGENCQKYSALSSLMSPDTQTNLEVLTPPCCSSMHICD